MNDAASEAQVRLGSTRKRSPATKQVKAAPLSPEELEEEKDLTELEWENLLTKKFNERWWRDNGTLDTDRVEEGMKGGKTTILGITLSDRGGPHGTQNARTANTTMQTQSPRGMDKTGEECTPRWEPSQ